MTAAIAIDLAHSERCYLITPCKYTARFHLEYSSSSMPTIFRTLPSYCLYPTTLLLFIFPTLRAFVYKYVIALTPLLASSSYCPFYYEYIFALLLAFVKPLFSPSLLSFNFNVRSQEERYKARWVPTIIRQEQTASIDTNFSAPFCIHIFFRPLPFTSFYTGLPGRQSLISPKSFPNIYSDRYYGV